MIKFKNTDYTLNDQGQWAPATAPNKLANQAMAKFLDNQHDIYLNSQPASPAPAPSPAPAATTAEPAATTSPEATPIGTTTPAEPAASAVAGAPVNSTVPINAKGVKVNFTKSADGWKGSTPGATLHKPGTTQYDSLEGEWARLNKQPAPAPTVTSEPEVAAPVAAESFRRLNKIIR
jgi:hypothetical protein